ncbi:hypothetical protein PHMEG_00032556 [Phytophthora megakarya]|uniref:Uncharacterized protein n=1 Tax=Phytophthora megakarya TaxID=4795 RepID=A0A225UWV7_9STRA|nr:hypothetical protein PHMEG_00032556 [Phytophthora megakarya]
MMVRMLRSEFMLRRLTLDCLGRRKPRPTFKLQLDHCIVEFVVGCQTMQRTFSKDMIVGSAKRLQYG